MHASNTSRRGFLKGMAMAGTAAGAAGASRVGSAAVAEMPPPPLDRAELGTDFPPEHFKIRRTPIAWPNKARIAVCWIVNFEGYSDTASSYDIAYKDYSSKAAVWRLADLFDSHDIKACWYTNAIIATRYPQTLRELVHRGHEIDGHNWANNISMTKVSEAEEREIVKRTFGDIEKACGVRPKGWMGSGGNGSPRTLEFLAQEGALWSSDYPSDDVPYVVPAAGKKMVIIPYQREANDTQTYGSNRHHPSALFQRFKDQFDVLYEEGATYPQMLFLPMHAWLTGHPVGKKALEETIRYAKGFPDVWLTTENEIAQWWLAQNYT
jgi:peptidoglycan/xylan/chitin deacetylase (PgdA/CDA1 family)